MMKLQMVGPPIQPSPERVQLPAADPIGRRYHIGDTPMDLQAADGAGAQPVGVLTGVYSRAELSAVSPGAQAHRALMARFESMPHR